jgi:hypothetical protein
MNVAKWVESHRFLSDAQPPDSMGAKLFDVYEYDIWETTCGGYAGDPWPTPHGFLWFVLEWYFERPCLLLRRAHCKLRGHQWESDDYGNADSGHMGATCLRCGRSVGGPLY